ncbi:hypothetical protein XENTR_v10019815 [Xenopus tropicalis]|nr:hypothetical protein XENTR_v10019815 [Xenopus tropicalis]
MPIRRAVNSSAQETPPKNRPAESEEKAEADASSEESASTGEEQETETPPATSSETEQPKESEPEEEKKGEGQIAEETKKEGEKEQSKEKEKKVKKTIPSWATLSASQRARAQKQIHVSSSSRPKMDAILTEAIKACFQKSGASVVAIRKYLSQHYPKLKVDIRPQLLKNALQRAVEKGQLEQITGKGASGTFQLKRAGDKPLLVGGAFEDAILSAITAMNEPKTCSTTAIKKYVLENHPGVNSSFQVHLLKRTLQKCEKNGWLEQISGKGFSGTYQLCFPYYPSPYVLFPEKPHEKEEEEESEEEESDEEEESEEEESEEEEPPPKRRMQKKAAPAKSRSRAPPPKPKKRAPPPRGKAKSTPKKAPPPPPPPPPPPKSKKGKAAPAPPPPPPAKKPASRPPKKAAAAKKAVKPAAKGKSSQRKSLRSRK